MVCMHVGGMPAGASESDNQLLRGSFKVCHVTVPSLFILYCVTRPIIFGALKHPRIAFTNQNKL
jgi:hypothetical protein